MAKANEIRFMVTSVCPADLFLCFKSSKSPTATSDPIFCQPEVMRHRKDARG
jgi:hypothetical protein